MNFIKNVVIINKDKIDEKDYERASQLNLFDIAIENIDTMYTNVTTGYQMDLYTDELLEYRISSKLCKGCKHYDSCMKKKSEKSITISYYKEHIDNAIRQLKTSQGKYLRRKRQSTVEPVFGTLMNNMGMKKVLTKGISSANKVFIITSTAYNLKKYMKFITNKANVNKANFGYHIKNSLKRIKIEILNHDIQYLRFY